MGWERGERMPHGAHRNHCPAQNDGNFHKTTRAHTLLKQPNLPALSYPCTCHLPTASQMDTKTSDIGHQSIQSLHQHTISPFLTTSHRRSRSQLKFTKTATSSTYPNPP
ncbi:hypothetical protein KC19_VG191900 [Ceratodon purpureus]|uniref:Uncharacterized protein n=1 Tax=Ceratodon purpureus TaxID=3225 RepID=A0A8T0HS72_CERPU|nr:hypothetical protein KC19_VG191900 [Ceratodon purpureus]